MYSADFQQSRVDGQDLETVVVSVPCSGAEEEAVLGGEGEGEIVEPDIIDKLVSHFNAHTKNAVHKYNYVIKSETSFEVLVLFKHFMKKMGESQKYAYYDVQHFKAERKVVFSKIKITSRGNLPFELKPEVEFLPIKNLVLLYQTDKDRREVTFKVCYQKLQSATTRAENTEAFQDLVRELLDSCMQNLRSRLSVEGGRLVFTD